MTKEDFYMACSVIPWGVLSLAFGPFTGMFGLCLQVLCFMAYKQERRKRITTQRYF